MMALKLAATEEDLGALVDDYLAACRAQGLSRKTMHTYEYGLRKVFLPWSVGAGITTLAGLDQRALTAFQASQLDRAHQQRPGQAISRHTVTHYLRSIRAFLRWAAADGQTVKAEVKMPRLPERRLEVLSREEVSKLEQSAANERDALIIRLLADTGIRVGELVGLRLSDLIDDGRSRYVRVIGKGDKERLVGVPRLWPRLRRYATRQRKPSSSDRLFIELRRRPGGDYEALTESGVAQMVRELGQQVLGKRVYPHLLRHSFVTWALGRGMNPITLSRMVGHRSVQMIDRVYSHLSTDDQYQALLKALVAEE